LYYQPFGVKVGRPKKLLGGGTLHLKNFKKSGTPSHFLKNPDSAKIHAEEKFQLLVVHLLVG
jgi:hypothetical protein